MLGKFWREPKLSHLAGKAWFFLALLPFILGEARAQSDADFPGHLIIVGGGSMDDSLFHQFGHLAGGKDKPMVIIPTAMSDEAIAENTFRARFERLGFSRIQVLHTRNRLKAGEPAHVAMLREASGVYFSGGQQSRLADAYLGTAVETELKALLLRGGVIMGTSAGATIMGSLLIGGEARAYPNLNMPYPPALNLLDGTVLDQHVLKRNRQFDLIPVLEAYPQYLGIAIDEGTAAVVTGRQFRVWGPSYVLVYDPEDWQRQRKEYGRVHRPFHMLADGQGYDLVRRKVLR